ncbi:hypothetical protein [Ligilactobacillus aviarius]|uniref:hypothetical protein n=1 Tax=Ligilactobacillus aviarius TaxID=1606 RepID=UPI0024BB23BE|nr:hypothetical protein [Ligilactobacillus aviarius]
MKKKITEEQLNALAEAVRKELKENDSDVLYFDECDYFWSRDQNGNKLNATDFVDQLGIKLGLYAKIVRLGEFKVYRDHPRVGYLIVQSFMTFALLYCFGFLLITNLIMNSNPAFFLSFVRKIMFFGGFIVVSIFIITYLKKHGMLLF